MELCTCVHAEFPSRCSLKEQYYQPSPIYISYTLDSTSHPVGEQKLKPDRSRILREAAILVSSITPPPHMGSFSPPNFYRIESDVMLRRIWK